MFFTKKKKVSDCPTIKLENNFSLYLIQENFSSYLEVLDYFHNTDKPLIFFRNVQQYKINSNQYVHTLTIYRDIGSAPSTSPVDLGLYNYLKMGTKLDFSLILTTHFAYDFLDTDLYACFFKCTLKEVDIQLNSLIHSESLLIRATKFLPFASQSSILNS